MPVVSKQKTHIDGREHLREISYSSKDKNFFALVPDFVKERLMLPSNKLTADTEQACAHLWNQTIQEYHEAKRETSTVILFRIKLQGFIPPADQLDLPMQDHNKDRFVLYEKDIEQWDNYGAGLLLEWGVYKKEKYKERISYSRVYWKNEDLLPRQRIGTGFKDGIERRVGKDIKENPHTPERQEWFSNLQYSVENLLLKIKKTLKALSPEELMQLVDNNGFKLLNQ